MNIDFLHLREASDEQFISANDCFNALTNDQKELVENSTTLLVFKKGETIIKQGYAASHVLYIENGVVKLDVTNDSRTSTVKLIGADSFVGIICSFACKKLDFSAVALEDTTIRMINMEVFNSLIKVNGEFAFKLIRHMSTATNSMVHWISKLSAKNVEGSLAMILHEFMEIYKNKEYTLPVTRIGLASLAGCSRESVINTLNQLHNDKIIEVNDKNIKIIDEQRLKLIIKNG